MEAGSLCALSFFYLQVILQRAVQAQFEGQECPKNFGKAHRYLLDVPAQNAKQHFSISHPVVTSRLPSRPGHLVRWETGLTTQQAFWSLDFTKRSASVAYGLWSKRRCIRAPEAFFQVLPLLRIRLLAGPTWGPRCTRGRFKT